jgi:ketosteroid isomerase-like protein
MIAFGPLKRQNVQRPMKSLDSSRHPAHRVAVLSAIIALSTANAVSASSDSAAEIRAVMAAQVEAWNRGDIDGFMDGYAHSNTTEFVSGDKLTRGWQTVRDRYKKKYDSRAKMGTLTFSEIKITNLAPDAALVLGRWKLVRKSDKPHGIFTLLFRHTPAGWRIVHDHTSAAETRNVEVLKR